MAFTTKSMNVMASRVDLNTATLLRFEISVNTLTAACIDLRDGARLLQRMLLVVRTWLLQTLLRLAEQHPPVLEALLTIAGNVRSVATVFASWGSTEGMWLMARDTVAVESLARFAISRTLALFQSLLLPMTTSISTSRCGACVGTNPPPDQDRPQIRLPVHPNRL